MRKLALLRLGCRVLGKIIAACWAVEVRLLPVLNRWTHKLNNLTEHDA